MGRKFIAHTLLLPLLLSGFQTCWGGWASDLKPDEVVHFFPTSATLMADGQHWHVPLHGWIYEEERDSLWRNGTMALLEEALEVDRETMGTPLFRQRAWPFIVDNQRGKRLTIEIAGTHQTLPASTANGHFMGELRLSLPQADSANRAPHWLAFRLQMPAGDPRRFGGELQLVPPRGLSVISDIDDTIKKSNVLDKEELLANTFLRDFVAVPGMAVIYQRWAAQGAAFHYVTGSPWQLHAPLEAFLAAKHFPRGSFSMRDFRLKDTTFFNLFASAEESKVTSLEALFQAYPQRRFILVGDSGEKDPEVYAEMARRYPDQVVAIAIRNVTAADIDDGRFGPLRGAVPGITWQLFATAEELTGLVTR